MKEKNASLISSLIPIKYFPGVTQGLRSLIDPSIKECQFYDECKFIAHHFENGSSHIKGIYFYQFYSAVAHYESFRINIAITAIHRLTDRILDVINVFQNKSVPIHERVY